MKHLFSLFFLFFTATFILKSADYLPIPSNDLVRHIYYTLSYNEQYEQANWVYYVLTDSMVLNSGEERRNSFKIDKLVVTGSAKSSDYTKSGYDRGHLCPAADMGFSPISMSESFLMSNVSPQAPDFNRGIWKELETDVRNWAKKEHKIIVVTGPVFKNNKGTIGEDKVTVPGYFFKLIYDTTDEPKLIAFLLPNAKSNRPITDFAVSTDSVESLTGYDFFSQLPDELEARLESKVSLTGWFDGYTPMEPINEQAKAKSQPVSESSDYNFYLVLALILFIVILLVYLKSKKRR